MYSNNLGNNKGNTMTYQVAYANTNDDLTRADTIAEAHSYDALNYNAIRQLYLLQSFEIKKDLHSRGRLEDFDADNLDKAFLTMLKSPAGEQAIDTIENMDPYASMIKSARAFNLAQKSLDKVNN